MIDVVVYVTMAVGEMGNTKFFTITEIFLLLLKNAGLLFANGSTASVLLPDSWHASWAANWL